MSLNSNFKVDEVLQNAKITEDEPRIYATGVYLVPTKISVRGIEHYVWAADDFDNDSHCYGKIVCPRILAENKIDLIKQESADE